MASRDLSPGVDQEKAIHDAIDDSRVIVKISIGTAPPPAKVSREVDHALASGMPVVPLHIEEPQASDSALVAMNHRAGRGGRLEKPLKDLVREVKALLRMRDDFFDPTRVTPHAVQSSWRKNLRQVIRPRVAVALLLTAVVVVAAVMTIGILRDRSSTAARTTPKTSGDTTATQPAAQDVTARSTPYPMPPATISLPPTESPQGEVASANVLPRQAEPALSTVVATRPATEPSYAEAPIKYDRARSDAMLVISGNNPDDIPWRGETSDFAKSLKIERKGSLVSYAELFQQKNVLLLMPARPKFPAVMDFSKMCARGSGTLRLQFHNYPKGDTVANISLNDAIVRSDHVRGDEWVAAEVSFKRGDRLQLQNHPNGWFYEHLFLTWDITFDKREPVGPP